MDHALTPRASGGYPARRLALGLLCLAVASCAEAQIQVGMKVQEQVFLQFEPVMVTLELDNHTPRDVVIGSDESQMYLTFNVRNRQGEQVGRYDNSLGFEPIPVPRRSTIQTNLNLGAVYDFRRLGSYTIQAVVTWNNKSFVSPNSYFDVLRGAELLSVVSEYDADGTVREYTLQTIHRDRMEWAFLRIEDEERCYGVFPLGRIIKLYKPTMMLDGEGLLHILMHTGPATFVQYVIAGDGSILKKQVFASVEGALDMTRDSRGRVSIATEYDDF